MSDNINPTYYRKGIETTDYIVSHSMNYLEGNIIKYVTRYKDKGGLEDLKKAEWYLTRLIKIQENNNGSTIWKRNVCKCFGYKILKMIVTGKRTW